MRKITGIEMANSTEVYEINYAGEIEIKPELFGSGFNILIDNEEANYAKTKREARKLARDYIVNDYLIVCGYGKHSGRKFWQLPKNLQSKIKAIACR